MDLVSWIYDHPALAVALLAAAGGFTKWCFSIHHHVESMHGLLRTLVEKQEKHEERLDDHETRISGLEIIQSQKHV